MNQIHAQLINCSSSNIIKTGPLKPDKIPQRSKDKSLDSVQFFTNQVSAVGCVFSANLLSVATCPTFRGRGTRGTHVIGRPLSAHAHVQPFSPHSSIGTHFVTPVIKVRRSDRRISVIIVESGRFGGTDG